MSPSSWRDPARRLLISAALLLLLPLRAWPQAEREPGAPQDVLQHVVDFYNSDSTVRLSGESSLGSGSEMVGDVAVLGGPFTLGGRIRGDLVVIDGELRFEPGAEVTGSVLVVGGSARGVAGASVPAGVVVYPGPFRYRLESGKLVYTGGRTPGVVAGHEFGFGRADFLLAMRGGYNRVEGLPIAFGPRFELGHRNPTRIDGVAIYRSATGLRVDAGRVGYVLGIEQYLGGMNVVRFGARVYSEVSAIEDMGLTDRENSLATFILHRDYRDHYRGTGFASYVRLARRDLPWDLAFEFHGERDLSLQPHGIWAIFDEKWREQPVVAEGMLHSLSTSLQYDTRNDPITPAAGWFVTAGIERGLGGSLHYPERITPFDAYIPPPPANPDFTTGTLDIRRYARLGPSSRLAVRAFASGSVDGKPLPPQRQLALGGEGNLPGYRLYQFDCGARDAVAQYAAGEFFPYYGCDRAVLFQLEYQAALPLARRIGHELGFRGDLGESLGWVAFYDVGRAWTGLSARNGRGGGQVDMAADAGIGLRIERIGIYWALPLSARGQGLNLFVRVGPRL